MGLIEALRALNDFKDLALLVSDSAAGQEARWQAVQKWLRDNPTYETIVNNCLTMPPASAVTYLCNQWGIDSGLLQAFDPHRKFSTMAEMTIEQLQTLYRERKEFDEQKIQRAITSGSVGADTADHRRGR